MKLTTNMDWVRVSPEPICSNDLVTWATRPGSGATVSFCGNVRDTSGGRDDIVALEYETDVSMAERRIVQIITQVRQRWPMLEAVAIQHRMGRIELGETAVIVVISSAHRSHAFEAAQFSIDTVKACVPMWKRELWPGGSAWSREVQTILSVPEG